LIYQPTISIMIPINTAPIKNAKIVISAADNRKGIENHIKAALHHEEAAKNHYEAAKHHEAGDHEKASIATAKAHSHYAVAGAHQREDIKQHALIKEMV
jgi:hypothetical protein